MRPFGDTMAAGGAAGAAPQALLLVLVFSLVVLLREALAFSGGGRVVVSGLGSQQEQGRHHRAGGGGGVRGGGGGASTGGSLQYRQQWKAQNKRRRQRGAVCWVETPDYSLSYGRAAWSPLSANQTPQEGLKEGKGYAYGRGASSSGVQESAPASAPASASGSGGAADDSDGSPLIEAAEAEEGGVERTTGLIIEEAVEGKVYGKDKSLGAGRLVGPREPPARSGEGGGESTSEAAAAAAAGAAASVGGAADGDAESPAVPGAMAEAGGPEGGGGGIKKRVKIFKAKDYADSTWALAILWNGKRRMKQTKIALKGDGSCVWLDNHRSKWRMNSKSRNLTFYRDFFLGWNGKRIYTARLFDNCNEHYLEGEIKGWGPLFALKALGQFQAVRLNVDLDKHGPAPWEERQPKEKNTRIVTEKGKV